MKIGLFIPCYVDQLRPEVGMAVVRLFDALGLTYDFPEAQTCCGQPFVTAGEEAHARHLGLRFAEVFAEYDVVVTPSGSCAASVRRQLPRMSGDPEVAATAARTRELCEFLQETGALVGRSGRFAARVGLHASCHALRELGHGRPSESRGAQRVDPARALLASIEGLELAALARADECCGFGGLFAVEEEAVSGRMGRDRVADHARAGAEVVTSTDVSCLLQLEGIARKSSSPLRFLHVAEILAASFAGAGGGDGPR
jgi:L-lactate dehydrogenase complex protein LldE